MPKPLDFKWWCDTRCKEAKACRHDESKCELKDEWEMSTLYRTIRYGNSSVARLFRSAGQ